RSSPRPQVFLRPRLQASLRPGGWQLSGFVLEAGAAAIAEGSASGAALVAGVEFRPFTGAHVGGSRFTETASRTASSRGWGSPRSPQKIPNSPRKSPNLSTQESFGVVTAKELNMSLTRATPENTGISDSTISSFTRKRSSVR